MNPSLLQPHTLPLKKSINEEIYDIDLTDLKEPIPITSNPRTQPAPVQSDYDLRPRDEQKKAIITSKTRKIQITDL